ncbi:MAG: HD domain-containing protein [Lentisphaeria bacterium]|nr:HD domain-containing protein [Lentisphaeria bacterium]
MEFRKIFDTLYDDVQARLGKSGGCHDFDHTLRVVRNAEQLCKELPEAHRQTVLLAALLHDIARPEEDQSRGAIDHAAQGATMVPELLKPFDLPPELVNHIADIVRTHRYRGTDRPATLEAEIVYDADKLDSLGAVGLGRAFLFAGKTGARLHNDARTALTSQAYSVEDTAYREYLVKLRKLPEAMLTRPAWLLARKRADFMKQFFMVLDKETDNRKEIKMKLECPYCWQHYEIAKSDMNKELVCINCEQSFRVQDALIIDNRNAPRKYMLWLVSGMAAVIVLLLALNVWILLRPAGNNREAVIPQAAEAPVNRQAAPQADLQTVVAPLYRTIKDFRAENEKLSKQIAILEQARQDLAERLEKAEKQLASNTGNERAAATEESINTLSIKIESANAQIKVLDEYHKQLLKGLTDLRTELHAMNLTDRLTTLERKAEEFDLNPVYRRIDKLDALVNAIRTVSQ